MRKDNLIMDNIFCIECGFELPSTAKFCLRCGGKIPEIETQPIKKKIVQAEDVARHQYKENQNERERDGSKPLSNSKPKDYNWINWDDDKEYT
jgi:predicted amidophosphoribosyltransferase